MSPVLKINPDDGSSLDKNRTIEQVAAEIARKTKELEEYRERIKTKKPRKKKKETSEVVVGIDDEVPLAELSTVEIPVKVDPLNAPNREVPIEELIEPLNAILENVEHKLELITKGFKLKDEKFNLNAQVELPKEFAYKPSVTRVQNGDEAFNLVKPTGVTTLKFDKINKDVYVDRVLLNPVEVKELLKNTEKAQELFDNLVINGMYKTLFETKQLDSGRKKYIGTKVATLKRSGMGKNYCFKYTGDLEFIEIRLFSDITEVK